MLKAMLYWMLMAQQCPGGGECVPIHPAFTIAIHVPSTHMWPSPTSQGTPITVTSVLTPATASQTIEFSATAAADSGGHSSHRARVR